MAKDRSMERTLTDLDYAKYDFRSDTKKYEIILDKGLNEKTVREISRIKKEPPWMTEFRLKSLEIFNKKPMPSWGPDLSAINFDEIIYYMKPSESNRTKWEDVPEEIKKTFDRLGIPEAERKFLGGVGSQYESEVVYHSIREDLQKQGVVFLGMDQGLKEYEEIVRKHFGTIVPPADNKFAALNSAVWSGGSFLVIPKNTKVDMPLQAYFRINAQNMGQFERTLIIAEEGSRAHYLEACSAPRYSSNSLHSAVVEIIAKEGAHVRYTTIQNWSNNIYNLVTKRAFAHRNATVSWVDGNIGCLAEGSTVTTPEGVKTIESLEVGDKVLSFDEKNETLCFQPVIAKRFSGYQKVHKVSVGKRTLFATANHPFYSFTYNATAPQKLGRYKLGYVRADQLKKAIIPRTSIDYGTPFPLKAPNMTTEFKSMNQYNSDLVMTRERQSKMAHIQFTNDDIMWLFGYWTGDGNIEIKQGKTDGVIRFAKVGFSTPQKDRARTKLMQTMTVLIDAEPTERADGLHLAWNSKELAEFFQINEIEGRANEKRVPKWVWSLPQTQRLAFIAGYIDADGHFSNRRFNIKSVNRALLEDIASLLVTLGITSRLYTEFSEPKTVMILGYECTAHGSHRLVFDADERFTKFVSPVLQEKVKNKRKIKQQFKRTVGRSNIKLSDNVEIVQVNVSEASKESVPTWDIEVEGTGNFVSQGFIVHNSKVTQKYPSVYLVGEGSKAEILSVALAGRGQQQDAGAKAVHMASNTTSTITSKSISKDGGRTSYRGLVRVRKGCKNVKNSTKCDALLLDDLSRSDTYPTIQIDEPTTTIAHEATVGKVGDDQIFYLMSRGLKEDEALALIIMGFIQPFAKELPMEYALELNRLIQMEMEDSVG